jgi:hypothetical protein
MECLRWEGCDGGQSGRLLQEITPGELTRQKNTAEIVAAIGVALEHF